MEVQSSTYLASRRSVLRAYLLLLSKSKMSCSRKGVVQPLPATRKKSSGTCGPTTAGAFGHFCFAKTKSWRECSRTYSLFGMVSHCRVATWAPLLTDREKVAVTPVPPQGKEPFRGGTNTRSALLRLTANANRIVEETTRVSIPTCHSGLVTESSTEWVGRFQDWD